VPLMDIKKRFGLAVKARRTALGISQEELAMRIGADQAYVSRIEAGQMNVTLETAEQVAEAMQSDIVEMFSKDKYR
jgi:transcriptional regulator with XRE-family HTH domain